MSLRMEVQIPSRAFFEIFKVKMKETENFLNLMQLRAEREKAQSALLEEFRGKSALIFQEGKEISSYMKVFNAPLKEEMLEAIDHRETVSSSFTDDVSPIRLLQEWIDKNGNEGNALLRLAKKTIKNMKPLSLKSKQRERFQYKNAPKKFEELDLNLTCQGKYGGSLQQGERKESLTSKKRRIQFESEEDRLRSIIEKSFNTYKSLIAEEIDSRSNFLKTMSAIRDQCSVLESRRLSVVVEVYNRYISLIELAEPLSPRRELVLHQMRSLASGLFEVQTNVFKQWSKEKTRYYNFELFTDDWSNYGLGVVTNNVPDVEIPANLQVVSESDKTDSSHEERSGPSHKDNRNISEPSTDFHHATVSDQSDQSTNHGSQRPERSRKNKKSPQQKEGENMEDPGQSVTKVSRNKGSRVKGQITSPNENEDTPALAQNKTNRKQVVQNPPPKSSTDGWRATQTPLGNLTLPVKSGDQTKRRGVNSKSDGLTPVCSGNEIIRDRSLKSPDEESNERSASDTSPPETKAKHLQVQIFTGTDHPYYTPGDPEDLETIVLPDYTPKRPEAPFKPMINNWMEPEVDAKDANPSDKNLLSQFLTKTKTKFRKSKKAKKSKSPEIGDSGPVPLDFGCDYVDEVSTVVEPFERVSKGGRAPPSTPGSRQPVEKAKATAQSGSDSSANDNREAREAKRRPVRVIKLHSIDSYEAKNVNEISFVSGQTVKMIHKANAEGMAYGYTRSSRMGKREYGYFPINHVVRIVEDQNQTVKRKVTGFLKKH